MNPKAMWSHTYPWPQAAIRQSHSHVNHKLNLLKFFPQSADEKCVISVNNLDPLVFAITFKAA